MISIRLIVLCNIFVPVLGLSLAVLAVIIAIYAFVRELRETTHGKMVVAFVLSLFTCFFAALFERVRYLPVSVASYTISVVSFWGTFEWNLVMFIDVLRAFWSFRIQTESSNLFKKYCAVVYCAVVLAVLCVFGLEIVFQTKATTAVVFEYLNEVFMVVTGAVAIFAGICAFRLSRTLSSNESFRFQDEMGR